MPRWALILVVTASFLAYAAVASAVDVSEVFSAIAGLDAGTWLLVLTLSLVNYGLRFGRWHMYLRDLGHRIPITRHLAIYISGFALTPTPGKIGEGLRAVYLKPFGVGVGRSLSTLYAERVLDVMAVGLLAILLSLAPIAGFRWLAVAGMALAATLLAAQHPAVLALTDRLARRLPMGRLADLGMRVTAFQRDVTSLIRRNLLASGLCVGLVAWAAEGLELYVIAKAAGIDLGLWSAIGIYATAMLAGALSFIPGGLGSTEAVMVVLLSLSGASMPAAIAATGLVRLATLWFAVALGVVAWAGLEASRPTVPAARPRRDTG